MGASEAALNAVGVNQCRASHDIIPKPTDLNPKYRIAKKGMPEDAESTDVYHDNLFQKYLDRQVELADLTYFQYVKEYTICDKIVTAEDDHDSDDPGGELDMKRRRKPGKFAILRPKYYPPYGKTMEKHCEQLPLLNLSWESDNIDSIFSLENEEESYVLECLIRGFDVFTCQSII